MPNIRHILDRDWAYWSFCREERNFAAVLYHLLLCGDNLQRFCDVVGYQARLSDPAVYFEYAYLRDLWNGLGGLTKGSSQLALVNSSKREAILELLNPSDAGRLATCSVQEFNQHFGAVPKASTWCIQSPGAWSLSGFKHTITDPGEFLRTCKFKWAFNAKPDIVIHADLDHALCIEAKLESGEGQYPTSQAERALFKELGLAPVSQTELQRYLMRDMLGMDTEFLFLAEKTSGQSTEHRVVSWKMAFNVMDYDGQPSMVTAWAKRILELG
jgi:hypothetical protein